MNVENLFKFIAILIFVAVIGTGIYGIFKLKELIPQPNIIEHLIK